MSEEREQIIADIVKELESMKNIALIRFILNVIKAFKKDGRWDVA